VVFAGRVLIDTGKALAAEQLEARRATSSSATGASIAGTDRFARPGRAGRPPGKG
jgi:hypothetical protein